MELITSMIRPGTPDFPLSVSYFAPSAISAPYSQSSDTLKIVLMHSGQVEARTRGKSQNLSPGDICIIRPHDLYMLHTVTLDTRYVYLKISQALISLPAGHFFQEGFVRPLWAGELELPFLIRPGDALYDDLFRLLSQVDVQQEGSPGYTARLFSVVMSVCAALMPACAPAKKAMNTKESIVQRCMQYMNENFARKLTLQEIADQVHLHPNYLCALFKSYTGISLFEHLTHYRFRSSAGLLRSTGLPIRQIAERCGFQSAGFFSLKFREYYGYSPSAYRKQFAPPPVHSE